MLGLGVALLASAAWVGIGLILLGFLYGASLWIAAHLPDANYVYGDVIELPAAARKAGVGPSKRSGQRARHIAHDDSVNAI